MVLIKSTLLTISCLVFLHAEPFSFGVRGGVPLTARPSTAAALNLDIERWTVGPTVEFRLPFNLSVGADALYRRTNQSNDVSIFGANFRSSSRTHFLELPYYGTYRLNAGLFRPFVRGGGAAARYSRDARLACVDTPSVCAAVPGTASGIGARGWSHGFLFGGGIQAKMGPLKLEPEFRYTRWISGALLEHGRNQPSLLLGISF